MRKKFLVTAATLAATVMLAACGNNANTNTTPTPNPTQGAVQTPAPTDVPEVNHEQMMNNIHQAVQEAYGPLYSPSMQMQQDEFYMGDTLKLDASWYDRAIVEVMGMAVIPDTFILIHPTEGNLENVKNAMEAYKTTLTENSWYPTTVDRAKGAITGVAGDYVYFVVLTASVDDMNYETSEQLSAACKESTQLAVNTIAGVISGEIEVEPWTEMEKMMNTVRQNYGDTYLPNVRLQDEAEMLSTYLADTLKMDAAWVNEAIIEVPMISANADTFIFIDPTDGNQENVYNALVAYKNYLVNETRQYPVNVARVQSAVVKKVGDYVCFSILGGVCEDPESWGIMTDEDLISYYENQNMTAIYALQGLLGIWE